MAETFSNQAVSTLSAAITTTTATSCTVTDATTFPATGNFRIKIDSEILLVTTRASNTFTVTRGQEGTTAATHASGASVIHLLTKASMEARVANRFLSDLYANKPAAGVKGRLFLPTDGCFMEYDDGANWHKYGPYVRMKAPPQTGWSWVNQGNTTATFVGSTLVLEDPDLDGTAVQLRLYVRSLASGCSKVAMAFGFNGICSGANIPIMGFCGYTPGGTDAGNLFAYGLRFTGGTAYPGLVAVDYTSTGVVEHAWTGNGRCVWPNRFMWIKYELLGKAINIYWSVDGVNWILWDTQSFTSYNAPTQFGVFIDPTNNTAPVSLSLVHWEES